MKGRKDTVNGLEKGEDKFMKEQDKRLQDLGVQISIYRKQKKMTQAQLAVEIGISRTHMSNIEALNMRLRFRWIHYLRLRMYWELKFLICLKRFK